MQTLKRLVLGIGCLLLVTMVVGEIRLRKHYATHQEETVQ